MNVLYMRMVLHCFKMGFLLFPRAICMQNGIFQLVETVSTVNGLNRKKIG